MRLKLGIIAAVQFGFAAMFVVIILSDAPGWLVAVSVVGLIATLGLAIAFLYATAKNLLPDQSKVD